MMYLIVAAAFLVALLMLLDAVKAPGYVRKIRILSAITAALFGLLYLPNAAAGYIDEAQASRVRIALLALLISMSAETISRWKLK